MGAQHHSIFSHRIISLDRKGRKEGRERRSSLLGERQVCLCSSRRSFVRSLLLFPRSGSFTCRKPSPFRPSIFPLRAPTSVRFRSFPYLPSFAFLSSPEKRLGFIAGCGIYSSPKDNRSFFCRRIVLDNSASLSRSPWSLVRDCAAPTR